MIVQTMTTNAQAKKKTKTKSLFSEIGKRAMYEAQKKLLLETLEKHDWNLTKTAEFLGMGKGSAVISALKKLAPKEYETAKKKKLIVAGNPRN